jgi:hypothetical protein
MAGLRTEFSFTLPKGYVDADGGLHRRGTMRLATARDEIEPLRDRTIDGPDDPYLTILVLARVVTELGTITEFGVDEVEGLFAADLAFLQDLYGIINFGDQADVEALQASVLDDEPDQVEESAPADADDEFAMVELTDVDELVAAEGTDTGDTDPARDDDVPAPLPDDSSRAPRRRGRIEEVPSSSTA